MESGICWAWPSIRREMSGELRSLLRIGRSQKFQSQSLLRRQKIPSRKRTGRIRYSRSAAKPIRGGGSYRELRVPRCEYRTPSTQNSPEPQPTQRYSAEVSTSVVQSLLRNSLNESQTAGATRPTSRRDAGATRHTSPDLRS